MVKRKGLPEINELVLVTVNRVTPYAAWCRLDEYQDVEGMIHISEVAGKWIYDIREFVKAGKQYVAKVVRIDRERNLVNLSLKRVSKKEEKEKMNAYRREQRAEKILEQAAKELGKNLEQAYDEVGYLLREKFGELFVALEEIRKSPEVLTKIGITGNWRDALVKIVEKSFKEKEIIIKAEVELKSYARDGVEKIKETLDALAKNTGGIVKYISAPTYRVEIKTKDPKQTEKKLREELEVAIKQIEQFEGEGSYKLIK
jgi:translation initiation factor 2 subunit 1